LYFVNWQRQVSIEEWNGRLVVVKRNKPAKEFHEFVIVYTYSLISLLLAHPSRPSGLGEIMRNEGSEMRSSLSRIGIPTPELISISETTLIEEYMTGGDLYAALSKGGLVYLARKAGLLTAKLHGAGYAFIDNKAQNFLVDDDSVVRTDLGFTQKNRSSYARSMDLGSFLASVMDLEDYGTIADSFYDGYRGESGRRFTMLSIIIRNLLSIGFSSNSALTLRNMLIDTRAMLDV
jgi:tRNA A-37 threonylcarbamoyl transferase component Bud32